MTPAAPGPLWVMGAGSVGCYVGGSLAAAGVDVTLIGRPRVVDAIARDGLSLTALDAPARHLGADRLRLATEPAAAGHPSLVLLCVKSAATEAAAMALQGALAADTPVLSLQNGVDNAARAARAAPALRVLPGMVGFNIALTTAAATATSPSSQAATAVATAVPGPARAHRGTSGELAAQADPALQAWLPAFARAGLPLRLHADLQPVLWGKLLLNLNNPVNALSGRPLRAQLLDRDLRRVTAALMDEALAVLAAAGIRPARLAPLPAAWLPTVLRLPTPLFRVLALRMLRVDAEARSSMADDLAAGRPTEVDALCGAIVRLAARHGHAAPRNARMVELVQGGSADPQPRSGGELLAAIDRPAPR